MMVMDNSECFHCRKENLSPNLSLNKKYLLMVHSAMVSSRQASPPTTLLCPIWNAEAEQSFTSSL
jgi:hypothetical protein